jgi:hypothetical protein
MSAPDRIMQDVLRQRHYPCVLRRRIYFPCVGFRLQANLHRATLKLVQKSPADQMI